MQEKDLVIMRARVESMKRTSRDFVQVSQALDSKDAARSLRSVTHPVSLNKTIRKVGIALALAPEPFTTALGIAMVAGSLAMKSREPVGLGDLGEAVEQLGDLSSLTIDCLSLSL
ncbi:MAG: hypothetical protein OK456_01320 [Thaumarchaeota archaeon]|nr:hypothetical protein [Nitrososphaerota archaeon]